MKLTSKAELCATSTQSFENARNRGKISSIVGASATIASLIEVRFSIRSGIGTSGFTNSEKRSTIFPPLTLTAPISMIRFSTGENPVVSRSKTTKSPSRAWPLELTAVSTRSFTR